MKHNKLVSVVPMSALLVGMALSENCGSASISGGGSEATVTVDLTRTHQTITGWEASLSTGWQLGSTGLAALADSAVRDLGISRIVMAATGEGIETSSPGTVGTSINDDSDPHHINPAGFQWAEFDERVNDFVLPLRANVLAAGRPFAYIVRYVGMDPTTAYQQTDPAEYAEFVQAVLEHLRTTFGIEPDYLDLRNEPDAGRVHLTAPQLAQMLDSAVARIRPLGFTNVKFIAPSPTDPNKAVSLMSGIYAGASPAAQAAIGQITYHRYVSPQAGVLAQIANLAAGHSLPTGMTEYNGSNQHTLYQDLTQANVSTWQKFALAGPSAGVATSGNQLYYADPRADTIAMRPATFVLRQYFRYVPPGSVRVGAAASLRHVEPTAYRRPDGGIVVVANVTGATTLTIEGLPAGTYHVSYGTASAIRAPGPGVTISAGETLSASIPTTGVITVAP